MDALLKTVSTAIASTAGTFVISAIIGVYGLYQYMRFRQGIGHVITSLREAVTRLELVTDDRDFARRYQQVEEHFSKHALLGHAWKEFCDSLIPPSEDDEPVYGNPHEAAEYFNADSVARSALPLRFYQAVPSYLTGLGILGTFIGLVAGIYLAGSGLANSDVEKTRQALAFLLSGASVAFFTSIVGLVGSLLFSSSEKHKLHTLEQEVERWNAALDMRVRRVTPEYFAAKQVAEAYKQTRQLERFNTDLAVSIASALEERLTTNFSPRLNQLVSGIDQLRDHQQVMGASLAEAVTANMREVSGAAGDQMHELAHTLGGLVGTLRQSADVLSGNQAAMVATFEGVIGRMEAAFGQSTNALATETNRSIERLVLQLEAAGSTATNDFRNAGASLATTLGEATAGLSSVLGEVSDRLLVQMDAAGGKAAEHLTVAGASVTSSLQQASRAAADSILSSTQQSAETLKAAATEAARQFADSSALVASSAGKFGDAATRLQAIQAGHSAAVEQVQAMLRDLRETHGSLRASAQPLVEAVTMLRAVGTAFDGQVAAGKQTQESFLAAAKSIQSAQEQMQNVWQQYEGRFEQMDESLGGVLGQLTDGARSYSDTVREFVVGIDKSFARSLDQLSAVLAELDESIQAFGDKGPPA